MKKTVKTKDEHIINFSIENAAGSPIDDAGLERLEKQLFDFLLTKAEPDEDRLFVPSSRYA